MKQNCPICGGPTTLKWPSLQFWTCTHCGVFFRHPMPAQEELSALYQKSWSEPLNNTSETGGTNLRLARIYAKKLARSLDCRNFQGQKILDFGAGRGSMLTALAELGAEVYGVEPFGYTALQKEGFAVFENLADLPDELIFDGVVSLDVIEHLATPWQDLKALRDRVKTGGWVFIATPNAKGISPILNGEKWREARKAGHLILFSSASLAQLLAQSGFSSSQRLRWYINYGKSRRRVLHYVLQLFGLDGELRYISYNHENPSHPQLLPTARR